MMSLMPPRVQLPSDDCNSGCPPNSNPFGTSDCATAKGLGEQRDHGAADPQHSDERCLLRPDVAQFPPLVARDARRGQAGHPAGAAPLPTTTTDAPALLPVRG
jgi:hypothetical protein